MRPWVETLVTMKKREMPERSTHRLKIINKIKQRYVGTNNKCLM
jgi:hypothetical protein